MNSYSLLSLQFGRHPVDAESFPYVIKEFPLLSEKGPRSACLARSLHARVGAGAFHSAAIYTADDVDRVIRYGAERGIRVVVEFDVPGHSHSWGFGYPDVTTKCTTLARNVNRQCVALLLSLAAYRSTIST